MANASASKYNNLLSQFLVLHVKYLQLNGKIMLSKKKNNSSCKIQP